LLPGVNCAISLAPTHPNLQVTPYVGAIEKQRKTYLLSNFSPDGKYAVYNNTIHCSERAVKERVFWVKEPLTNTFCSPPRPAPNHFAVTLENIYLLLKKNAVFCNPWTTKDFALSYQAPKRDIYLKASDSLNIQQLRSKDAYIQAFTKCEKYKFEGKVPVPRIIQPRSPRYNVSVGRYLKPIEKRIYESVNNIFGSKTIMKGMNMEERASVIEDHFNSFNDPVAVGLDASRFDQHVSKDALKWEHSIYDLYYRSRELRGLLKQQLVNKCYINQPGGHIRYKTDGCRMSGDMNTSLGNCLLMSSMVWTYAQEKQVTIKLVNDGDDCVVFMSKKDLPAFMHGLSYWFLCMGFNMTIEEPVYILEQVAFCSSNPVRVDDHYIMVRDPRKVIVKDNISLLPLNNYKLAQRWLAGVGIGGMSMVGGVPILQDFYQSFVDAALGAPPGKNFGLERMLTLGIGMDRCYSPPTPETRYSFYLAFGIDPACQIAIEEKYRNSQLTPYVEQHIAYVELPMEVL
jgi:hypothetical protein